MLNQPEFEMKLDDNKRFNFTQACRQHPPPFGTPSPSAHRTSSPHLFTQPQAPRGSARDAHLLCHVPPDLAPPSP
eukprot:2157677-Rhodomonas_salina.2